MFNSGVTLHVGLRCSGVCPYPRGFTTVGVVQDFSRYIHAALLVDSCYTQYAAPRKDYQGFSQNLSQRCYIPYMVGACSWHTQRFLPLSNESSLIRWEPCRVRVFCLGQSHC